MNPEQLINKFYTSFAEGNWNGMTSCYHDDIMFQDPAFGQLTGERAKKMWEMLLSQKNETTKITFANVQTTADIASAKWTAEYIFGEKKRKVINNVTAKFKFKDGKIIEHIDSFNMWKWSKQALGMPGYLLGWTSFMKNKVQKSTNQKLDTYIKMKST